MQMKYEPKLDHEHVPATLVLEDGTKYHGYSFGAMRSVSGEAVFQTGMVGYPEAMTDPSYEGQILCLTYPLVGNYGVPGNDADHNGLPKYFESDRIHIAALIVQEYSFEYSHWQAVQSLSDWLVSQNVPAVFGIDTRALTKRLREKGCTLAKVIIGDDKEDSIPYYDPNVNNLVEMVSCKAAKTYKSDSGSTKARIMAVDVGMKYNQIRCFTKRDVELTVVPWNHNIAAEIDKYDGLFLSNGPGDPTMCKPTIEQIKKVLERGDKPVFGICLGHQLLALAAGAQTKKMKFGNRGHNIPCTDQLSNQCYITTQNHGFMVDPATLPEGWAPYFVNANDETNEGIIHMEKPFFSVQFHPEASAGPRDTEYMFDMFIEMCVTKATVVPPPKVVRVPNRVQVNKILVLGSGGLSIGQAGEFDYSGSQCIKALKEEGIEVVLINPNIATIQTSKGLADKVYFLPVTPEYVIKVIKREQPDGLLCTFGGQTALNCAIKIRDELEGLGVKVLGTPIETIMATEDRDIFNAKLAEINEKTAISGAATTVDEALAVANNVTGYPVICRAAYALGGLGSGFANNDDELRDLCAVAFAISPQVLIEKSMKGWKEIEYEVVRDAYDNCITVCNMENFDPLGVHTGDSIVVAPSQTLTDAEYQMLRDCAIKTIRHLGVVGECNIQYALNPYSMEYCIIEVNARLSRSSALASKATGYPLAFVAAKLALGIPLTEVKNKVTQVTCACFEPSLDYCVIKIPRWDLTKFSRVSTRIGSQMKSVGEVMSVARTFEEAMQKAIRSVDDKLNGFQSRDDLPRDDKTVAHELENATDLRVFYIATAFEKGWSVDKVHELTRIDRWFLYKLHNIVRLHDTLREHSLETLPLDLLRHAKKLGFGDKQIGTACSSTELAVRQVRKEHNIMPWVKQIDTVAAEFPAYTNYLYPTYNASSHDVDFNDHGVMVLGSGVYRIGSSVEFDWCAVNAVRTLRDHGYKTIMLNYNPETVSTDFDEVDRLYFNKITLESVLDIYDLEQSAGVLVSMGGQTPNNIALALHRSRVNIFGTSPVQIDMAENRYKFSRLLDTIGVDQPQWKELTSFEEADAFANDVGYPVLVRPSYVLSGAAMTVVYSPSDLVEYLSKATAVSREHPVVISKFIEGAKEIEMDCVAKDGQLVMHVISEHVENAGVHSGDATLIQPPQDLDKDTLDKIVIATQKIAQGLRVTGPMNIQFIAKDQDIKVIEANVRASRSFPFVSKALDVNLIELATKAMMDLPFTPYPNADMPAPEGVCVKVPQFSFSRLSGADPVLGVEMASTGEVACFGRDKQEAYLKGLLSVGFKMPNQTKSVLLSIGSYKEKAEFLPSARKLLRMGYRLFASPGTADFLSEHNVEVTTLDHIPDAGGEDMKEEFSLAKALKENLIGLYINLPSRNRFRRPASFMSRGYVTRRMAVDYQVPLITNIKCAKLFIDALQHYPDVLAVPLSAYDTIASSRLVDLPGLVEVAARTRAMSPEEVARATAVGIQAGFTLVNIIPSESAYLASLRERSGPLDRPHCDFALSAVANISADAAGGSVNNGQGPSTAVLIDTLGDLAGKTMDAIAAIPAQTPVMVRGVGAALASVLFMAQVQGKAVHVVQVSRADDMRLIVAAKERGMPVTCDVNPAVLALTPDDCRPSSRVPAAQMVSGYHDVAALWEHLGHVDCFSAGTDGDLAALVPIVLTLVAEGRLTLDDVVLRLCDNPRRVLHLAAQPDTFVEIDLDKTWRLPQHSILGDRPVRGCVRRVVLRGQTAFVDGKLSAESEGIDVTPVPGAQAGRSHAGGFPSLMMGGAHVEEEAPGHLPLQSPFLSAQKMPMFGNTPMLGAVPHRDHAPASAYLGPLSAGPAPTMLPTTPYVSAAQTHKDTAAPRHVVSIKQFDRSRLHYLFQVTNDMQTMVQRMGSINLLQGHVQVNLFYEPSTRTSCSFQAAMQRLGGQVITVDATTSSVAKGESLKDTIRCLESYADVIVLRHPVKGSAQEAANVSSVPIINAGDGIGEHPTQALLDLYTIREELGTVNGATVTMVGDLKNGRTCHSLVYLLMNYNVRFCFVSDPRLAMPKEILDDIAKSGHTYVETADMESVLGDTDVLYVTRIQKERFDSDAEYEEVKGRYKVTPATLKLLKERMCILHPLPRVDEISPEVDYDLRAAYFRQMKYGLYVRMALLAITLHKA